MRPSLRMLAACVTALTLMAVGGLAHADREGKRDKIREKLREMRMARLIEELDLDEATAAKLLPKVNSYYEKMGDVQKDTGEARRNLRGLLDAEKVDDAQVNKLIDRMLANREKVHQLENDMIKDVRKILKPAQVAKLIVVLPRINRGLEKKVRDAAHGGKSTDPDPGDDE